MELFCHPVSVEPICCQRKNALDRIKQAGKNSFKTILIGEIQLNSSETKMEEFPLDGVASEKVLEEVRQCN